jgi:hypothetical protein
VLGQEGADTFWGSELRETLEADQRCCEDGAQLARVREAKCRAQLQKRVARRIEGRRWGKTTYCCNGHVRVSTHLKSCRAESSSHSVVIDSGVALGSSSSGSPVLSRGAGAAASFGCALRLSAECDSFCSGRKAHVASLLRRLKRYAPRAGRSRALER